jgi:hypothetical protein
VSSYHQFFNEVEFILHNSLSKDLNNFNYSHNSNWMRIRYSEFKNSMYELQFAKSSKHHAAYFGTGYIDLIAFYYGNADINKRFAWVNSMQPIKETISEKLGMPIVIGRWSDNWAWMAVCLQKEPGERDVNLYAKTFSKFIEETYYPIKRAHPAPEIILNLFSRKKWQQKYPLSMIYLILLPFMPCMVAKGQTFM